MPTFRVLIPYTERHHNYPDGRVYQIDFEVEAEDWLDAVNRALERFAGHGELDYHSWHCEPHHAGLEVVEIETGKRFHITDGEMPPEALELPEATSTGSLPYAQLLRLLREDASPDVVVGKVLDLALNALDSDAGAVLVVSEDGSTLSFAEARGGAAEDVLDYKLGMGEGIAGWSAQRGETFTVSDASSHPKFFRRISDETGYETKSIICAPARTQNELVGVLELLNRRGSPRFPTVEVLFAESCARIIALLLASDPEWVKRPSVSEIRSRAASKAPAS